MKKIIVGAAYKLKKDIPLGIKINTYNPSGVCYPKDLIFTCKQVEYNYVYIHHGILTHIISRLDFNTYFRKCRETSKSKLMKPVGMNQIKLTKNPILSVVTNILVENPIKNMPVTFTIEEAPKVMKTRFELLED